MPLGHQHVALGAERRALRRDGIQCDSKGFDLTHDAICERQKSTLPQMTFPSPLCGGEAWQVHTSMGVLSQGIQGDAVEIGDLLHPCAWIPQVRVKRRLLEMHATGAHVSWRRDGWRCGGAF